MVVIGFVLLAPSALGRRLSAFGFRLSAFGFQLSAFRFRVLNCSTHQGHDVNAGSRKLIADSRQPTCPP
jgi:hypothetical protein